MTHHLPYVEVALNYRYHWARLEVSLYTIDRIWASAGLQALARAWREAQIDVGRWMLTPHYCWLQEVPEEAAHGLAQRLVTIARDRRATRDNPEPFDPAKLRRYGVVEVGGRDSR